MNWKKVSGGLLLWVITSVGIGYGISTILDISFLGCIICTLLVQFFVGDLVYRIFAAKNLAIARQAEEEITKQMSQQYAQVACPCDKKSSQLVMLNVSQENIYNCNACNKELKCLVGWRSFQTTEPLTDDPFKKFNFVENKEYEI